MANHSRWRILTVCGSLRANSSNRALLSAYARVAPPTLSFEHSTAAGLLPHFNPDLDGEDSALPTSVLGWRNAVARADALVISTPEYAHGLPGAFKNALDWLVSDPTFVGKPVVILHLARGSSHALESLREILSTMSASLVETAAVSLVLGTNRWDESAILGHEDHRLRSSAAEES